MSMQTNAQGAPPQHPQAQRIQELLGPGYAVIEFADSTHTASQAAERVGCEPGAIAKSLAFA